jgi:hypothetical protein
LVEAAGSGKTGSGNTGSGNTGSGSMQLLAAEKKIVNKNK